MTQIDPSYSEAMRSKGFSHDTLSVLRKIECPVCGFSFSLTYARTFACRGCPMAVKSCPKARCAKCDHEFYIKEFDHVATKHGERRVADHMSNVVEEYINEMGWKKSR